jgi:hypothetical protein
LKIFFFLILGLVSVARADYRKWYQPIEALDGAQAFVSDSWSGVNYGVDSFFANENYSDAVNRSYIQVGYGIAKFEGEEQLYNFNLKIKVDFPNSKRKFKIVFETSEDEIEDQQSLRSNVAPEGADSDANASDTVKEKRYNAAIRSIILESKNWKAFIDTGMRLNLPLDPFVKSSVRRTFDINTGSLSFIQKFNFFRQNGFEEISSLDYSYEFSKTLSLGVFNSLAWTDLKDTFTIFHSMSVFSQLSERRAVNLFVSTSAVTKPVISYDQYTTGFSYRQLIHKTWLFAQLGSGVVFLKSEGFNSKPYFEVKTDLIF